jgi:ribonuclease HI
MLEKLGFVREGILRDNVWKDGPTDECLYGLLRGDWRGARDQLNPREPEMKPDALLNFDGASRGNPGQAGAGAVLKTPEGAVLSRSKRYVGHATNNVAEYHGLLLGLEAAHACGIRRIHVRGDAEVVVKQVRGENKVKAAHLRPLHARVKDLLAGFDSYVISHVKRPLNSEADKLANEAIDEALEGLETPP